MKFNKLLIIFGLVASVSAVYPPVKPDLSLVENPNDLVTIQDSGNGVIKSHPLKASTVANDDTVEKVPESKFKSFYMALSMIFVSEIGDKTFLLAALMAMRHPHMVVFSAAGSALVLMTILSGLLGFILPNLLSPTVTRFAAAGLFLVFGVNLLREGLAMDKSQGVDEELAEVEEEVAASEINARSTSLEEGGSNPVGASSQRDYILAKAKSYADQMLSPAWVQTFIMTFLGEWGDRSQIATIAMAAGSNYLMVILGGSIGHLICTFGAVWGGQILAKKISMRTVILGGSAAFFLFSVLYLYSAIYEE